MVTSCNKLGVFSPCSHTFKLFNTNWIVQIIIYFRKITIRVVWCGVQVKENDELISNLLDVSEVVPPRKEASIKKSNFRAIHKNWAADPAAPHPSRSAAAPVAVFWLGVGRGKAGAWLRTGPELTRHLGAGEQHLSVPCGMSSSKGTFGS